MASREREQDYLSTVDRWEQIIKAMPSQLDDGSFFYSEAIPISTETPQPLLGFYFVVYEPQDTQLDGGDTVQIQPGVYFEVNITLEDYLRFSFLKEAINGKLHTDLGREISIQPRSITGENELDELGLFICEPVIGLPENYSLLLRIKPVLLSQLDGIYKNPPVVGITIHSNGYR